MRKKDPNEISRIESNAEVITYLDRLKYALENGSAQINFQKERRVDANRNPQYTNRHTMLTLFPNEDAVEVLQREMASLTEQHYIETVQDRKFPKRSEMRVFSKQYSSEDVYIKIRVELFSTSAYGKNYIFIMSFHFAEEAFEDSDFPYRKEANKNGHIKK